MRSRSLYPIGVLTLFLSGLVMVSSAWFGISPTDWFALCMKAMATLRGYSLLAIGIAIMILVLTVEWQAILNNRRLMHMSLAQVESTHPRLPSQAETIITILFSIALTLLFFQFTSQVFALAFVLSSSSSESYQSEQVFMFDADSDGDTDYVVLNGGSDPYELYKNNGGGAFTESVIGMGGNAAHTLYQGAVGDIDNDGDIDVVVSETVGVPIHQIEIFKNSGVGTFASTATITLGAARSALALVDVDTDGDLDIVSAEAGAAVSDAVHLNDGHGTFSAANSTLPASDYLVGADVDSDGDQDLILGIAVTSKVYKNSGTGAFTSLGTFGFAANGSFPALGDLDSDGDIDVLIARSTDGKVRPYLNDGAGAFSNGTDFGGVADTRHVAIGDVDNDGDFDAIIAGFDSTGTNAGNEVWLNNGSATFTQDGLVTNEDDCTNGVAIGEIDGDESLDYVGVNLGCSSGGAVNRNYINDSTNGNPSAIGPSTDMAVTLYSQNNRVTSADTTGDVGQYTAVKIGNDGFPVVAYRDATNNSLKVLKCGNAACSTGNTTTTVATGFISGGASIAIPSDGFPVISFYVANLTVVKCGNAACSSGNTTTVVDNHGGVSDVGQYSSIAIGTDDLPIISYYNSTSFDLKIAHCGNAACTSSNTITTVDTAGDTGKFTSIAIPSDGKAVISYYDVTNGNLVVARCGAVVCVSVTTVTPDPSLGDVGQYTSIAILNTGFPVISYYDVTNADLKIAKCANADCSSSSITADNSNIMGADTGKYTSIAVPADGRPVVSFYATTNTRLLVLKFINDALTSYHGATIQTGGSNGTYTSIASPTTGYPVVSYYDATNGDLKVLKCGNPLCYSISSGTPQTDGGSPVHKVAWGSGSDTITPARLLQYQLKMGTGSSANNIVSAATASPHYLNRLLPHGQSRQMYLKNLTCNPALTYYWSVAIMDPGFKKSSSSEQTFALNSDCSIGTVGAAASSSSSAAGGGLDHRIFDRKDDGGSPTLYPLSISFVNDLNGNGKKDGREQFLTLSGIPVTASGRTLDGVEMRTKLVFRPGIETMFRLPQANAKGYSVTVDQTTVGEYVLTGPATQTGIILKSSGVTATFGMRRHQLTQYKPCLQIGERLDDETTGTDAWILLQRLEDPYGKRILGEVDKKEQILSRRSFFTILSRITCTGIETNLNVLKVGIRQKSHVALPLVDLPLSATSKDSLVFHSLLAAGVDAARQTTIGPAADLSSPVSRSEILRAIASLFPLEKERQEKTVKSYLSSSSAAALVPSLTEESSTIVPFVPTLSSSVSESLGLKTFSSSTSSLSTGTIGTSSSSIGTSVSVSASASSSVPSAVLGSASSSAANTLSSSAALTTVGVLASSSFSSMATNTGMMSSSSSVMTANPGMISPSSSSAPMIPRPDVPEDIDVKSVSAVNFLVLDALKVLPQSFRTVLGIDLGVTSREASLLLVRTAFRMGRIPLLPDIEKQYLKAAASEESFMTLLPSAPKLLCLERAEDRSAAVMFTDILPGDSAFDDIHSLLSFKTQNADEKDQWLLTATRRPTEFGILKGQTKALLDEPVSLLETLRSLLVLSCTPPETRIEVMQNGGKIASQGSAATRVARDMITDLPRDVSFASRVLYKSQDHQQEFDLSLLSYAPALLRKEPRSPADGFSVDEAGDVLASGILAIAVREHIITPQQAEGMANPMAAAIRKDLAGEDIDWRSEEILRRTPLTRGMLLQFLTTVISDSPHGEAILEKEPLSAGQLWWDRIK